MRSLASEELSTGESVRQAVRNRRFVGTTSTVALGFIQANLTILPERHAEDFLDYCDRNSAACPVLAVSTPGAPFLHELGADLDVRTDVPGYLVFEHGVQTAELSDLDSLWHDDLVSVATGCSFSFDKILLDAGVAVRHVLRGSNGAMWRTNIATTSAGPFHGELVVSMRPMKPDDVERAVRLTSSLPRAHGAPVHWGDPATLGIGDIGSPDYGDPVLVDSEDVPVFWACGVTAQVAVRRARVPLAVTHKPGCMLLTDLPIEMLQR